MTQERPIEIRAAATLEVAAETPAAPRIGGYAVVWDSPSVEVGPQKLREVFRRGAFAASLASGQEVWAYINHDTRLLLGRRGAGTLRVAEDDRGLAYEIDLPETQYARDLAGLVRRGDVFGASFGFQALKSGQRLKGGKLREIVAADLIEVSAMTEPAAYPASSALLRNLEEFLAGECVRDDAAEIERSAARRAYFEILKKRLETKKRLCI